MDNDTRFVIGEVAIMQNCDVIANEGKECTIIKPYGMLQTFNMQTSVISVGKFWLVKDSLGNEWAVRSDQLRKRKPPGEDLAFKIFMNKLLEKELEPV